MENKKENKAGKMTIEKLAHMVARGFEKTATKDEVNSLRGDFHYLSKKVDKLDFQIDEMYDILKRFEENDILNLQKRVQVLEKAVRSLAGQTSK